MAPRGEAAGFTALIGAAAVAGMNDLGVWGSGPRCFVHIAWTEQTQWDRHEGAAQPNWAGELTDLEVRAASRLPGALRRSPVLRQALATESAVAELLGRLAAAPDAEAIDAILDPG